MDQKEIIDIVKEFARIVSNKYDCVEFILFGSYVKETNHNDSDIDIAVILKDFDNFFNIQFELMRLRRKIDSRIEPHPIRLKDFNDNNPLVIEIKQHGQVIKVA